MDARLRTARRSVRTATRQAHAALVSADAAVLGEWSSNDIDDPANDDDEEFGGAGDEANDREGAELGLRLFGTSQSYMEKLEEEFAQRLTAVEGELDAVHRALAGLDREGTPGHPDARPAASDEVEEEDDGEMSAEDIPTLKRRIAFLRQCQQARKLLEDADTLSLSTNYAPSGSGLEKKHGGGGNSPGSVAFPYSPTSLCGPGEFAKFAFEADSPRGGKGESPLVRAATMVKEAEHLVDEVGKSMMEWQGVEGHDGEGNARMQAEMLDHLRNDVLQKRTELRHRASALIQNCVTVEENGLLIRGSGTAEGSNSGKKVVAFDVQASPVSAPAADESKAPPSPLSDAHRVLEALADPAGPPFGRTLDGAMRELSAKIYEGVLKPCLDALDTSNAGKEREASAEVVHYAFAREARKSVRSVGGDRRNDSVSVRGPAVRLGWTLATASFSAHDGTGDATVATAADLDETALQSPSPSLSSFLAALHLLSNVSSFVHEHALLRRSDLAAMLGAQLFGTCPKPKSAVLGMEDAPLMARLVAALRRCLPKENGPEAWRTVKVTEARLVAEVGAFERKMAEMGLMTDVAGRARQPTSPAAGASSSPAGLSVLVDSPIRPHDATATNLSALDASLEVSKESVILSPLSELAHSLQQAYVESQRCAILNRGRSLLLATDYHNTVSVGTDVPDLSEPGSLESLDDDLLTATFALHRCSVSTTAQQILDMVRETLDLAVAEDENDDAAADRPDALRPSLYRASRELLDLFRAIIPTTHAGEVGSVPRTAAVLHNDCVFLAHEALLLGAEYKGKFRSLGSSSEKTRVLGEVCTFVDMVPPFRDLATKAMGDMIELQKGQLYELVTPRLANFQRALASNEAVTEWDDADTALRAALHHLRHLSNAWRHVLSRQIYNKSVGNLVDVALTLYLDPVFKAEDISESASRFVHSLLLDAVRGMAEVFLASDAGGSDANAMVGGTNSNDCLKVAKKYSTLFGKAEAVGQFMPMRLDEIERGCEEGTFSSVSAKELSHLILAAFDDVPKRTALLNNLASASS